MNQLWHIFTIDLPAKVGNMNINDIAFRRRVDVIKVFPYLRPSHHLSRAKGQELQ